MKTAVLIAAMCVAIAGCDSKQPPQATVAPAAAPVPAGWRSYANTDKFSDQVSYVAELKATRAQGSSGAMPVLVAICNGRYTEAYIDWNSFVGSDRVYVQSRLDADRARNEESKVSADNRATFMPDSAPKLKEFLQARTFIASVQPPGGGEIYAEFNVSGAAHALHEIREKCGW